VNRSCRQLPRPVADGVAAVIRVEGARRDAFFGALRGVAARTAFRTRRFGVRGGLNARIRADDSPAFRLRGKGAAPLLEGQGG
jgi:hypothetical protein